MNDRPIRTRMPRPEELLACVLVFAWVWRVGSSVCSSYAISDAITPSYFGAGVKTSLAALQVFSGLVLDLLPLSEFPRASLARRILSIPSQVYTLYYANVYIGPALDSRRFTIFIYLLSLLCILETAYKINNDWNRIE